MQRYHYEPKSLPMEYIRDNGRRFAQYPECQRDFVWKLTMQQRLIETILRGLPIPPLVVVAKDDDLIGVRYEIVDGQQRYETIRRYLDNKFPAAKKWRYDPRIKPVCPGKRYDELSPVFKSAFDNYAIRADIYHNVSDEEIEMMFRNLQFQIPLTLSEKLWSYSSSTKELCIPILGHRFWSRTYKGKISRKESYQMTLMAVMMELYDTFCNLTTPRLKDTAAEVNLSRQMNENIAKEISMNLETADHLFYGAQITGISQFVPIYQAVRLLKDENCAFSLCSEGELSMWFNSLKLHMLQHKHTYNVDAFARLFKVGDQRVFWSEEMCKLRTEHNLTFKDKKRRFSTEQRLEAWIKQEGKCIVCGKRLVMGLDAHHMFAHELGGETKGENCVMLHRKCHRGLAQKSLL